MNQRSQGIFVACTHSAVFVRVVGRGACRNSEALRAFGLKKLSEGLERFYVDLSGCDGMDSTFLGVFAGIGLALRNPGSLSLLNLAGDKLKAFTDLGLDHIASIEPVAPDTVCREFPPDPDFELLPGSDLRKKDRGFDALERAILMLECHEDLCRLDRRNEEKFREVKKFLQEDIRRHSGENGHPS